MEVTRRHRCIFGRLCPTVPLFGIYTRPDGVDLFSVSAQRTIVENPSSAEALVFLLSLTSLATAQYAMSFGYR